MEKIRSMLIDTIYGKSMKIINVKLLLSSMLISVFVSTLATDRYVNYESQGLWTSVSSKPAVKVFIEGSAVKAKLLTESSGADLPAIKLKTINSLLLNEYTEDYIKIQDFNNNGQVDIGILKSVGYGGSKRCYSVFEYQPDFYSYSSRATKTICIE